MMREAFRRAAPALAIVLICTTSLAQEGYPLDGTWRGTWGGADEPNRVVIIMKWNGETITGMINPGPNSYPFDSAALDASDWGVHITATTNEGSTVAIDGTLTEIGSYNRRIVGTWVQDGVESAFEIARE
jgi:hypothetical protein